MSWASKHTVHLDPKKDPVFVFKDGKRVEVDRVTITTKSAREAVAKSDAKAGRT